MKVVIPMAGMGKRFIAAGYQTPKTLTEIEGRPVVAHVVGKFSKEDQFVFGINKEHAEKNSVTAIIKAAAPKAEMVVMPFETGGPVTTVKKMQDLIRDDEPVIVNYCDFSWVWDYEDFKRTVAENDCDGAVVCYRGFHPHLLGSGRYATLEAEGNWMKEIREKHSWHDCKQKDWTSSGTYYFKKGAHIKKYFSEIEKRKDWLINGEHYVSQVFQLMKEDGLRIYIYEIPFMLQWGTPEDLEEYMYWSRYFRLKKNFVLSAKKHDMQSLILMAGEGKRFSDAGYQDPKPFITVDGHSMAASSALSLPQGSDPVFVTRDSLRDSVLEEKLRTVFPHSRILSLKKLTQGQAATALEAEKEWDSDKPLLIGACDHQIFYRAGNFEKEILNPQVDALIFTYRNNPNVRRNPNAYAWADADSSGKVRRVSVKKPLEEPLLDQHALIGSFWFRKASFFSEHARRMIQENRRVNGEFYIDEAMNGLVSAGLSVKVFEVDAYASWGTPDDLKTYEYWKAYFEKHFSGWPQPEFSVVIPAYNEEKNLPDLADRIDSCMAGNPQAPLFEWILVDNGSQDESWKVMNRLAKDYPWLTPVRVEKNLGYGFGILAGLKRSSGRVLAWTHADCQTDPRDVVEACGIFEKKSVKNSNLLVKGERKNRRFAEKFFSWGMQVWAGAQLGQRLVEINAQPKVFPRALYEIMNHPPFDFSLDLYLLYLANTKGYETVPLSVDFAPRLKGEAKGGAGSFKNRLKLIRRTLDYISRLRRRVKQKEPL